MICHNCENKGIHKIKLMSYHSSDAFGNLDSYASDGESWTSKLIYLCDDCLENDIELVHCDNGCCSFQSEQISNTIWGMIVLGRAIEFFFGGEALSIADEEALGNNLFCDDCVMKICKKVDDITVEDLVRMLK